MWRPSCDTHLLPAPTAGSMYSQALKMSLSGSCLRSGLLWGVPFSLPIQSWRTLLRGPVDGMEGDGLCSHLGAVQVVCKCRQHRPLDRLWTLQSAG